MRRRPLIGLTAAGLGGTLIGLEFQPPPGFLLSSLTLVWLLLLAVLFTGRLRARLSVITLGLLVLSGGLAALSACLAAAPVSPADLRLWLPAERKAPIAVTGIVTGDPRPGPFRGAGALRFPLAVDSLRTDDFPSPRSARGHLMVTWVKPRAVPPPAYGERWSVQGIVDPTDPTGIRTGPHGARFLERERGNAFRQFGERQRRRAARLLSAGMENHPDVIGLLNAILLGSRLRLPPSIRQDFMATGTFHVMAISGLHVGMIAWLLASLLRVCGLSRVWWFPILAPLLLIYTAGTGASASALRACIMALFFFAAPLVGRKSDAPSALAAAALLIVGLDPFQIRDRGFILSFTLVGGLLLVAPLLNRVVPAFLKPDPFLADDLIPAWKRAGWQMIGAVWTTLALSAAAWFTSLPLTAYFFDTVSLVALMGNMVAIPMAFLIVLTGSLSLILGSIWLLLGEILNYANLALVTVLTRYLGLLAQIPHACMAVPRPPVWVLPVWYAGLILAVFAVRRKIDDNPRLPSDPISFP